jgi:endonuclease/exonuclease/phosphatase family metal-dependent hydrolase
MATVMRAFYALAWFGETDSTREFRVTPLVCARNGIAGRSLWRMRIVLLWLLLAGPAFGEELKFSTWNLSWLTLRPAGGPDLPQDVQPKQPDDIDTLRRYALLLDADVVAFSEVDGPELAARVFPPDRYHIHITGDSVVQRTGFAIRRTISFTANPDLTALDVYKTAKYHLRSAADVTLHLPSGPLRLLAVHLKSGCREEALDTRANPACGTLALQVPHLRDWAGQREAEGVPFVLMGDFNRWMEGRDGFFAELQRAGPLLRAETGKHSPCWGGVGFLDHIIAGGGARAWMRPDSLRVLVYRESTAEMKERLSDHCPVSVRFVLPGRPNSGESP